MNTIRELKAKEKYDNMLKRKNKEKNIYKSKNSTLRIEKMNLIKAVERKNKEIERLHNIINDMDKQIDNLCNNQKREVERLNNIINELEKDVKERIDFYKQEIKEFQDDLFTSNYEEIEDAKNEIKIRRCHIIELEDTLDKIEELKGSDKE